MQETMPRKTPDCEQHGRRFVTPYGVWPCRTLSDFLSFLLKQFLYARTSHRKWQADKMLERCSEHAGPSTLDT